MWKFFASLVILGIFVFIGGVLWFGQDRFFIENQSCPDSIEVNYPLLMEGFVDKWNAETRQWIEQELTESDGAEARKRLSNGNHLEIYDEDQLPALLEWQDGSQECELGDTQAQKGGHLRVWSATPFPDTLRSFGPGSKSFYHFSLIDNIWVPLVWRHHVSGNVLPGLAQRWAVSADSQTVYYELDPSARYSNGELVRAKDFVLNMCLRTSSYAKDPYWNSFFRQKYVKIQVYGDRYLALTLNDSSPQPELTASESFDCAPPGFYRDFSGNFLSQYQWNAQPTTGAYTVHKSDVEFGTNITMRRVKNWWAKDKKYFRYRFNPDSIKHVFISVPSKGLELFKRGDIDVLVVKDSYVWDEVLECDLVYDEKVNKLTLPAEYPAPPYGFYFNTQLGLLKDIQIRQGLVHAFDMGGVIHSLFRDDKVQLKSYMEGYGDLSLLSPSRTYDVQKATEYFKQAGFTHRGEDGILKNNQGVRLSFELTYADTSPFIGGLCSFLKQRAKLCGVELKLDPLHYDVNSKKVWEKRFQITFWAYPLQYPFPRLYKTFHSSLAIDNENHLIPHTNNLFGIADAQLDDYLDQEKRAKNRVDLGHALHRIQRRLDELSIWVPGWKERSVKLASWSWVHWPQSGSVRISPPYLYNPLEGHYLWLSPEKH